MDPFRFDENYVARLRSDDHTTWRHFYAYFLPRMRAKLRAQFEWSRVDDLVGETMLAVVEKIKQGEPKDCTRLAPYVLSICQHKALEFLRRNAKEKFSEVDWSMLPGNGQTPDQLWESEDQSARVRAVLDSLSPKDRQILIAIFHHRIDRDLVCKQHGISRDQLKMILFRARQRFQKKWEEN